MSKEDFFKEALAASTRTNESDKVSDCFADIAKLWNAYVNRKESLGFFGARDVACMMILLKVARAANGYNIHDSLVDIAGYAACADEIHKREVEARKHSHY